MSKTIAIATALLLVPGLAHAQTLLGRADSIYTWRGPLPAQALFSVRNYNGPVDVRPASGSQVEFRAEKRTSRGGGALQDVAFDVRTASNGDVTICSTFRSHDPCESERRWNDDDDGGGRRNVTVAMTVLVPRGAQVKIVTGNGAITVERVGSEVQATTGNGRVRVAGTDGSVRVTTGNGDVEVRDAKAPVRVTTGNGDVTVATTEGPVDARSGNGDIDVRISALRARNDMTFSTGSGSVHLTLPASYSGELDASTGNGEMRSDFDLKLKGRVNPRRIRATIGEGGPLLRLSTGNGGLEVRKAP
jgi:hypothetical protein